ncbi:MAG: hypothetical protein JWM74_5349 [Myxococcaceae bacterium]|jgi:hypothetical protein|nr:hypothetical protein [Myxococcaceae bacterium]
MRSFVSLALVLVLLAACGGKIAPGPATDAGAAEADDDIATACERPRAARLSHTCPTSCATTSTPDRAFTSTGELLDFMQTRWIACSEDVAGLAANGIAFHDGCSFSWLVDGNDATSGSFAVTRMRAQGAEIVLHADGEVDERLTVSMSECPNQLRVVRNAQTIYLMAEGQR